MHTFVLAILIAAGSHAALRDPEPAKQPAPPQPTQPAQPTTPPAVPSLDEALGLSDPDGNVKPLSREQLDKALAGKEEGDEFKQAVALMGQSAKRLVDSTDTGVSTQRLQQDAIDKLEAVIKKAQQKKNQSSSQSQPQPGQKDQQQSQPQQSDSSQQKGEQHKSDGAKDTGIVSRRDGQFRPALEAARAAWGNLPDRIRQMLMQGSGDQFSKEYQKMTEEYYKKLGEQGK